MNVVTDQVPMQEGATTVRLHAQFDGSLLLHLAPKDLGDNALHLSAIPLVNQAASPGNLGITADAQQTLSEQMWQSLKIQQEDREKEKDNHNMMMLLMRIMMKK